MTDEGMRGFLGSLKGLYNWILIDTPPMGAVADALSLASFADGVVVVAGAEMVPRKAVRHTLERIAEVGARMLGIVLNRAQIEKHALLLRPLLRPLLRRLLPQAARPAVGEERDDPVTPHQAGALTALASREALRLRVAGACMEPHLRGGDVVDVRSARVYWPGDLLAFLDGSGRLRVHRLIGYRPGRRGLRFWTQADASSSPDSAVPPSRVVGRVSAPVPMLARVRAVGRLARHLTARLGAARS